MAKATKTAGTGRGAPPQSPPHDFMAHIRLLRERRPEFRFLDSEIVERVSGTLGRDGRELADVQVRRQLNGKARHSPRLPTLLVANLGLARFGITPDDMTDLKSFTAKLDGLPSAPTGALKLHALLRKWHDESPMTFSVRRFSPRIAGDIDRSPLPPGWHDFEYDATATSGIHLLVLEFEQSLRDWQCVNVIKSVALSLDKRPPKGALRIGITNTPSECSMYAIASPGPFLKPIEAFVEHLRTHGSSKIDEQQSGELARLLEQEQARGGRSVGEFSYSVGTS